MLSDGIIEAQAARRLNQRRILPSELAIGVANSSIRAEATTGSAVWNAVGSSTWPSVEQRWRSTDHSTSRRWRTRKMSEEEWLADFIKQVGPEALMRAADNELDYARARFKRSVERLFEREVARIVKLIEEPGRYSVREWEKVRTYFEWIARRFTNLVEQMEQARPLTTIDDTPVKDAVLKPGGGKPKLTESEVSQIKALVNAGELSLEEIAKQFDVSPAEISGIKNERYWPLVEPRIVGRLDRYQTKLKRRM